MAKKNPPKAPKPRDFGSDPFNPLKGFAVSESLPVAAAPVVPVVAAPQRQADFADEMAMLGVKRIDPANRDSVEEPLESLPPQFQPAPAAVEQNDEDQFLQALGELDVRFTDKFPDQSEPPLASARRMKQLKQGKLVPQASLDLHGMQRVAVAEKIAFFLQDAQQHGWSTLLVITGKGLHSADGEAVLRTEAERYLAEAGGKSVAEWGRAPRQYGGDGALVLFLRKRS